MIDPVKLVDAVLAGPLAQEPYIAALPMYDWPEVWAETDALWVTLRDEFRKCGISAPEHLTRRNGDLPPVPGGIRDTSGAELAPDPASLPPDAFDLAVLWQHPNLLLAQTCWGPLELWLNGCVRVVGQDDYSGMEGGDGEMYSSALVMRREEASSHVTEGGPSLIALLTNKRLAYNVADSMSGYLALQRDLESQGSSLAIFSGHIISGGHRNSIRAVAEGRADVTAIDAKTWALAQQFEPTARALSVAGWTGKRKGLPFVTAKRPS